MEAIAADRLKDEIHNLLDSGGGEFSDACPVYVMVGKKVYPVTGATPEEGESGEDIILLETPPE